MDFLLMQIVLFMSLEANQLAEELLMFSRAAFRTLVQAQTF